MQQNRFVKAFQSSKSVPRCTFCAIAMVIFGDSMQLRCQKSKRPKFARPNSPPKSIIELVFSTFKLAPVAGDAASKGPNSAIRVRDLRQPRPPWEPQSMKPYPTTSKKKSKLVSSNFGGKFQVKI